MWNHILQKFDTIKVDEKITRTFTFTGNIVMLKMIPSCSCTGATWNETSKTLVMKYKGQKVPIHLKNEGKTGFNVTVSVQLEYLDEGQPKKQQLLLNGRVEE